MTSYENGDDIEASDEDSRLTDVDGDSAENVLALLISFDEQLEAGDKIPPAEEYPEGLTFGGFAPPFVEAEDFVRERAEDLVAEEFNDYVKSLKLTLGSIGLADPVSVSPENLKEVDGEVLEQLDSLNAEALFFDVARRVRKQLGVNGAVTWQRLAERAHPRNADGTPGEVINLDKLRLSQSLHAVGELGRLGINALALTDISKVGPSKQQNLNRLAYLYLSEPGLKNIGSILRKRAEDGTHQISIERAVRIAKVALGLRMMDLDKQRRLILRRRQDDAYMDSIDEEEWHRLALQNKRRTKQARSSRHIAELILKNAELNSVDALLGELSSE